MMRILSPLAAISAIAAVLGLPAPAGAGTFDVNVCDAAPGFVNNAFRPDVSHGGMTTYSACPSGDDPRRGLGARHNEYPSGWTVPTGAAARWIFTPPPGTAIVGIRADALFEQNDHRWQVGLSNGSQLLAGCSWRTDASTCSATMRAAGYRALPPSPVLYSEVFCAAGPCPVGGAGKVWARSSITYAQVTIADASNPAISGLSGDLWTDRWVGGLREVRFNAVDNTGIKDIRVLVDGVQRAAATRGCDSTIATCADWPDAELNVATMVGIPDGRHVLEVQATDRAGNTATSSRPVSIDNTPPASPTAVAARGGDVWRTSDQFKLGWTNPRQDAAPIAGAEYRMCPGGDDGDACVRGRISGENIDGLDDLRVPGPGDWSLKLWLRDEAGNAQPETAAAPVHLRFDPDLPAIGLLPSDPENPSRVRVRASDGLSGIDRVEVAMRRKGAPSSRLLPVQADGDGFSAAISDEHLADGAYELRAHAWDRAGNERSTERLTTGAPATVMLPVRIKARMRVGERRRLRARAAGRRRHRIVFLTRPILRHGRRVRLRGRLTAPGGNPLQGVKVQVFARLRLPGRAFQPVATLRTSRTGRFTYLLPAGPNRILRFRYPGAPLVRAQTREIDVRVRAATTMRASRRSVVNGEPVTFVGRVRGGRIPEGGKLLELQWFARGKFRTFRTFHTSRSGRWRYTYRYDGTRGRKRDRLRIQIPTENGYPYVIGRSREVRVDVRGL